MEPKKGASSTLPAESKDFGHNVGWTSPVEPFPWDLKCLLPTCGRELIAEVATPCELLQRQLCSSPLVHVINQQLLPLRGTRARPPLQCPMGTFQVCGRQLTGRRSFCSAWLKGNLVSSFPSHIILIVLSSPSRPSQSTPGHRPHHSPKKIQLSPNFHLCMGVWIESLKSLNSSVSKLEETLNILRSILLPCKRGNLRLV